MDKTSSEIINYLATLYGSFPNHGKTTMARDGEKRPKLVFIKWVTALSVFWLMRLTLKIKI